MEKSDFSLESAEPHNIEDFFVTPEGKQSGSFLLNFNEHSFKRARAFLLCILTFTCSCISLFINIYEGSFVFFYPLSVTFTMGIACFIYLLCRKGHETIVAMLTWTVLLLLGLFIILRDPSTDHRSLLWISIFPPICVLTMGLRNASILYSLFMLASLIIFLSPLNELATVPLERGTQVRFFVALTGGFLLVSCLEYSRSRTYEALQNAVRHIGKTSLTDILTGLGNRRYCDKFLEWVMANSQRSNQIYAVALLDIDHFKRINDTFGHEVGDYILKHLAAEVKGQLRIGDSLFRWGGEEFIIVMPQCTFEEAEIAAERIRLHMQRTPFYLGHEKIFITISMGIYTGSESVNPKIPLSLADQCLYKAKSGGRNKFFTYQQ